eukprot:122349_1
MNLLKILFCVPLIGVIWGKNEFDGNVDCIKATVPFTSEDEALARAKYSVGCVYRYWDEDRLYNGAKGFEKLFGPNGYGYNDSTIIDGKMISGYAQYRAKSIVSQQLSKFKRNMDPSNDVELVNWGPYHLVYKYQFTASLNIPGLSRSEQITTYQNDVRYFEDDSGIIEYFKLISGGGFTKTVLNSIIGGTEAIANVIGLNEENYDDKNYYIFDMSPITIIFICVLTVVTTLFTIGIYLLCKFIINQPYRKYEKVISV